MSKTTTTAKTTTPARSIAIQYRAVDGAAKSGTFNTIKGAQAFAHKWVGATPELSTGATTTADSGSATAGDGVGRITWKGCTPAELFPLCVEPTEPPPAPAVPDLPAGTAARKASRKPGKVKTLTADQLAAQQAADQRRQYAANLDAIASWLPAGELEVLKGSAEHFDIVADMRERIADMPTSYSTTDQGDDAMVWLHYFNASSDWWLTEKDAEGSGRRQCFGFARLNGDSQCAELGYCDVRKLVENGVELDLHWTPVRLGDIVAKFGPASIRAAADDSQPPQAGAMDPEVDDVAATISQGLRIAHAADAEQQAQQQDAQRASASQAEPVGDDDGDELDEPPQAPADDVKPEALPPQQRIELPVRKLLAAVGVAAVKDVRYYLCTVMLHQPDDKGARIVSTDGARLLVQAADLPKPAAWMDAEGVLLSADDLREALPMLKKHGEQVTIEWGRGHSHATLRSADGFAALRVSIVEGKYPDYQRILSGVDLSNRGGEVGDAARINPDFLKGAAAVASLLGSKGVQAFAGSSSGASTFLFDGEADAVMLVMPMKGAECGAMVTAKVAGLVGAAGLASSVAALRAHLTRTTSALRRAAAEGADPKARQQLEDRRISLEQRIADTLALCSTALPAPAKA